MDDYPEIQDVYKSFEDDDTIGASQLFDIGQVLERLIKAENTITKQQHMIANHVGYIDELLKRIDILETPDEP
jgi:hypothetical protein